MGNLTSDLHARANPPQRDCRPDQTGLDDGPYLPGRAPRKRPAPKSAAELSAIRAKAWATRRGLAVPVTGD